MFKFEKKFLIIGHRGLPEKFPENTIKSFLEAERVGLDGVELDVQLSKDRKAVVLHDSDLERIASVPGNPWNYSSSDLGSMHVLSSEEGIPELKDVLRSLRKMTLIIELKTIDQKHGFINEGIEEIVYETIRDYDNDKILLVSFDPRTALNLKSIRKNICVGLNIGKETIDILGKLSYHEIKKMGLDFVQVGDGIYEDNEVLEFVDNGIPVIVWVINDLNRMRHLKKLKINGIITDIGDQMVASF